MSTDKPDEALKRLLFEKAFMRHYTNGAHLLERFDTGHYRSEEARAAWQIACIFSASLAAHEADQQEQASMTWKYKGHNSHVNEDDYECSSCKTEWGFPTHTDPDKEKIGCPRCKLPYRK